MNFECEFVRGPFDGTRRVVDTDLDEVVVEDPTTGARIVYRRRIALGTSMRRVPFYEWTG